MKNFTNNFKQFTSRLSARWLLMALMLLLGTSSAWGVDYWVVGPAVGGWDQWKQMNPESTTRYTFTVNTGEFKITKAKNWDNANRLDNIGCNDNNDTYKGNVTCNGANNHYANVTGTLCFDPTSNSNNGYMWIEPSSTPTEKIFYLVGNSTILFKEAWVPKVDDNKLVRQGDTYTYIKTYSGITFENNTTIEYKITAGSWGNSEYSCNNGNNCTYSIPKGTWDITFTATSSNNGDNITSCQVTHTCPFTGIQLIGDESQLNLGDVEVGQSKTVQIEFEYCGITGITPQFLNIQSGFSGSGSQDSNNRTITYNITFAPTEAGEKTATIYIAYANGGLYQKTVTANGVQSCQSANVAIDDWNIPAVMCKNVPATFTYSAEANAAVTWSTDNANFTIVDNNKTVTVTYTGDAESSNNVLKYTVSNANGFCPESGVDSGKKLSAQGGVQIEETTETDQTVCPQGTTTIGVTAGMTSYVWKYGEQVMNGKTTNSIEVGAGNYSVTATNANGCVSNVVNFTVRQQEQPITAMNIGFVSGESTVSSIQACQAVDLKFWATGATRYEIYENIDADNDIANDVKIAEGDMSGDGPENAIIYSISKDAPGTYKFYAKVLNECTSATLEQRTLTVPATIDAPKYTLTEPTKCGNSETPGSLAITQQVDGISYTINDIVTNNLTLEAADHIQPQTYTIKATKTTGSCTRTETTEVTVQTINNTPVVNDIAITTANTTVCAESELTLQLVGDAQDGVSFQWYKDEDAIVGATSSSLTIQNVTASDAGDYKLVASKTTPCTVTKESKIITISVDAQSKIEVSAAESFCLGTSVNLTEKITDATGTVTWYSNEACTEAVVKPESITVNGNATYYAQAISGVCAAVKAPYAITAKGVTISQDPATVHPYEVTTFTASGNASWQISTNPSTGAALDSNDPVFSGKTTAYITKADGTTTTFKGEAATSYVIKATADDCETTHTFNVVDDPNNCQQ